MVAGPSLNWLQCNYTKICSEHISNIVIYSSNNLTIMYFEISFQHFIQLGKDVAKFMRWFLVLQKGSYI
jgi:hypothetical protein